MFEKKIKCITLKKDLYIGKVPTIMIKKALLALTLFSVLSSPAAHGVTAEAREVIGKAAVEYLKNNPEAFTDIVMAVQAHAKKEQEKKQSEKLHKYKTDLFDNRNGNPTLGNPRGTTEMVVFMDPFCGYCRQFEGTLRQAVKANKNLKIIARDIAFMHEKSLLLVKATIAASKQGKYAQMQSAVHKVDPSVTLEDVLKMAQDLGLRPIQFKKDMESKNTEAIIKNNMDLADGIDLTATPTFIIKGVDKINSGALSLEELQKLF